MYRRILACALSLMLLCAGCGKPGEVSSRASEGEKSSSVPPDSPPELPPEIEPEPEPLSVIEMTYEEAAGLMRPNGEGFVPIGSPEELAAFSLLIGGSGAADPELARQMQFRLVNDIDMAGYDFTPIGGGLDDSAPMFTAFFDGQGYSIRNLTVRDQRHTVGTGLFGAVGKGGVVQNVNLIAADITGGDSVGGFAGICYGEIRGCSVNGTVRGGSGVGGFVGLQNGVAIQCAANAEVRGASGAGGFCGLQQPDSSIEDCYSLGMVVLDPWEGFSGDNLGGFIGSNGGTVRNCYAVTEVYTNFAANAVGAFAGTSGRAMESCYYKLESAENWKGVGRPPEGETGVTACTVEDITEQSTYADWDFSAVWNIAGDQNRGLPFLRAVFDA